MSRANVELFFRKINEDAALQEKIKHLFAANRENVLAGFVALGAEIGCNFSAEEIQQYMREIQQQEEQQGELDEAELEAVAGGNTGLWIVTSIFTAGVACLSSAIDRGVTDRHGNKPGCFLDQ